MDNYLPLGEAERIAKVSINDLNMLVKVGKIKTVMTNGQILYRASDIMIFQPKETYSELEGLPISIGDASRKYNIAHPTISRWVQKGYIRRLDQQGQKVFIDEADMARMAAFYATRPGRGRRTDIDLQK